MEAVTYTIDWCNPPTLFVKPNGNEKMEDALKRLNFCLHRKAKVYSTTNIRAAMKLKFVTKEEIEMWTAALLENVAVSGAEKLPTDMQVTHKDWYAFQAVGVHAILSRAAVYLGDQMGLGKTIQVAGAIWLDDPNQTVLIVCPASLKLNWKRELIKWAEVSEEEIYIVQGRKSFETSARIWIVNYSVLESHERVLLGKKWGLAVYDEAHYIKSTKAKRTKTARKISAVRKVALSGTPILNRPEEIYTTLRWLDPIGWPRRARFLRRYCDAHQGPYCYETSGASNLDELQDRLKETVLVRRLKEAVLTELPRKTRELILLQPSIGVTKTLKKFADFDKNALSLRSLKVDFTEMSSLRRELGNMKVPLAISYLKTLLESGEKVVCFAHHQSVLDALHKAFPESVLLDGRTSMKERDKAVSRFQEDPDVRVFFGQIQAAGVGITLTASSHVVFVEQAWSPGVLSQAEDRCHRIGQRDNVLVSHLVVDKSLDARIAQLLIEKQDVIDRTLDMENVS